MDNYDPTNQFHGESDDPSKEEPPQNEPPKDDPPKDEISFLLYDSRPITIEAVDKWLILQNKLNETFENWLSQEIKKTEIQLAVEKFEEMLQNVEHQVVSATFKKRTAILQRRELEAQAIQTDQKNIKRGLSDTLDELQQLQVDFGLLKVNSFKKVEFKEFCPKTFKVLETFLKEEWYRFLANVPLLEHENARQEAAAAKFIEEVNNMRSEEAAYQKLFDDQMTAFEIEKSVLDVRYSLITEEIREAKDKLGDAILKRDELNEDLCKKTKEIELLNAKIAQIDKENDEEENNIEVLKNRLMDAKKAFQDFENELKKQQLDANALDEKIKQLEARKTLQCDKNSRKNEETDSFALKINVLEAKLFNGQVKEKAAIDAQIVFSREALEKVKDEIENSIDKQIAELQSQEKKKLIEENELLLQEEKEVCENLAKWQSEHDLEGGPSNELDKKIVQLQREVALIDEKIKGKEEFLSQTTKEQPLPEVEKKKEALEGKLEMIERRIKAIRGEELKLSQCSHKEMKTLKEAQTLRCDNRHKMIQEFQIVYDLDSHHLLMTDEKAKMFRDICQRALRHPESTLANMQEFFERSAEELAAKRSSQKDSEKNLKEKMDNLHSKLEKFRADAVKAHADVDKDKCDLKQWKAGEEAAISRLKAELQILKQSGPAIGSQAPMPLSHENPTPKPTTTPKKKLTTPTKRVSSPSPSAATKNTGPPSDVPSSAIAETPKKRSRAETSRIVRESGHEWVDMDDSSSNEDVMAARSSDSRMSSNSSSLRHRCRGESRASRGRNPTASAICESERTRSPLQASSQSLSIAREPQPESANRQPSPAARTVPPSHLFDFFEYIDEY